ncbi:hypothetical protein F5Y14DRAFT_455942 [Nemania sp. NC0429]|nr:hypothetical protein F5Y14DRAFT_455942 [Nemania sp. NC0429]
MDESVTASSQFKGHVCPGLVEFTRPLSLTNNISFVYRPTHLLPTTSAHSHDKMFVLPLYSLDLTITRPYGTLSEAITNERLHRNDDSYMDLFKTLRKPTHLPYPPRPPTPTPPGPNPPIPRPNPNPTPPPSPQHLPFHSLGPQLSILISSAEPLHFPNPNPPPSPVPRRPGPLYPVPDVPTPPPSPRRSISPCISLSL